MTYKVPLIPPVKSYTITSSDMLEYCENIGDYASLVRIGNVVSLSLSDVKTKSSYLSRWNNLLQIPVGYRKITFGERAILFTGHTLYGAINSVLQIVCDKLCFVSNTAGTTGQIAIYAHHIWLTNDPYPD